MRSVVLSNRVRCLSRVAVVSLVGAITVGCSGDATRFDRALYSAVPKPAPNAYEKAVAANQQFQQQYPGDVDAITTAGISKNSAPVPLGLIGPRIAASDDGMQYGASQLQLQGQNFGNQGGYKNTGYQQPKFPAIPSYNPAPIYNSGVIRGSTLPKPSSLSKPFAKSANRLAIDRFKTASIARANAVKNTVAKRVIAPITKPITNPIVSPVKAAALPIVKSIRPMVDPVVTASVAKQNIGGWSKIGGTTVQMGSGETLYNLSKRYGVPVSEIMSANGIGNATDLKAGQNVLIPTYVYSKSAPISAPDSHPDTRAARSTFGNLGQPKYSSIPTPSQRPHHTPLYNRVAVVQSNNQVVSDVNHKIERKVPVTASTSSASGIYIVESGDSLRRIAINNDTSVSAIQSVNDMSGTNIRIGQKLIIPGVKTVAKSSSNGGNFNEQKAKLDGISTGTIPRSRPNERFESASVNTKNSSLVKNPSASNVQIAPSVNNKIASASSNTPKSSGIKSMRWPVSGRIVHKFGADKKTGNNDGIDISVPEGTSVKAAENGVVIYSGSELAGFGNLVLIRHDGGFVTAYAYNKSLTVQKGAEVRRGQVIARSGKTGDAETPMLHFEVRKNSRPVNPVTYLGT